MIYFDAACQQCGVAFRTAGEMRCPKCGFNNANYAGERWGDLLKKIEEAEKCGSQNK